MGPFIAYFPSWLKFHELFRFDAYVHPCEFVSENYERDLQVSLEDFAIRGDDWVDRFETLKRSACPFAFFNPAMQEGSTLGGPVLSLGIFSLPVAQRYMGLGSIWTIGPPLMQAPATLEDSKVACYRLLAFPAHWKSEIPSQDACALASHDELCFTTEISPLVPGDMMSKWENLKAKMEPEQHAIHIGAKMGFSTGNPDWTAHLPAKHGLLCAMYEFYGNVLEEGSNVWSTGHDLQGGSTIDANASIEPNSPGTLGRTVTPELVLGPPPDGSTNLEGPSLVSHEEVISSLKDKIRRLESQLHERELQVVQTNKKLPVNQRQLEHLRRRERDSDLNNVHHEPKSVLKTSYSSLKRKMQEEIYDPISKKMKPASQISLQMGSFSAEEAGRYMSVVHNEVFRVAGRARLINPIDFDVGSDGAISLSEHALRTVYSQDESTTSAKGAAKWRKEKSIEMSNKLRELM
ncbi:hypothetical protein IL306_014217 [Fusarium sp. DS 682]|nr:hypothetical protein IL306_014217 [Fusarium sp. DS 682]